MEVEASAIYKQVLFNIVIPKVTPLVILNVQVASLTYRTKSYKRSKLAPCLGLHN
jgi:hypothetical protein